MAAMKKDNPKRKPIVRWVLASPDGNLIVSFTFDSETAAKRYIDAVGRNFTGADKAKPVKLVEAK